MKILVIAPHFAPCSEVPAARMVSLCSYLLENKHQVTVVSLSKKMLLEIYSEKELSTPIPEGVTVKNYELKSYRWGWIENIINGLEFKRKLKQIVDLSSFDVVFVTCGPYYTLRVLPSIQRKYKVPYIIDFRDLGALDMRPRKSQKRQGIEKAVAFVFSKFYHSYQRWREKRAVNNAAMVISISEMDKSITSKAYGFSSQKIKVATNGYDEKKLASILPFEKKNPIMGAVFGKFMCYSVSRATAVLKAISILNQEGYDIKLYHIGKENKEVYNSISKNDIDTDVYQYLGIMEYSKGMATIGNADFFVVEDTSPDDVGTKIYDYIYWNKPIIAVVPKDIPLAKLVSSFEHGYICDNTNDVKRAIEDIVRNKYDCLDPSLDREKFSRKHQNQIMESAMVSVIKKD